MLVIWDYFGVVAENPYWNEVDDWAAKAGEYGELRKFQAASDTGKISWEEYCASVATLIDSDVETVLSRYKKHNINQEVIRCIHEHKNHTHVLLSNASHNYLLPIMEELGLTVLFAQIFVSSNIGFAKPDERAFLHVLDAMQFDSKDALMIDDIQSNIAAAKKLGLQGVVFNGQNYADVVVALQRK